MNDLTIDVIKYSNTTDYVEFGSLISENTLFITITLRPRMYKYTSHTQLDCTRYKLHDLIQQCKDRAIFVAELTNIGNIHYHGIIKFCDEYEKFNIINRLKRIKDFGLIHIKADNVDTMEKMVRVCHYMTKSLKQTAANVNTVNRQQCIVITSQTIYKEGDVTLATNEASPELEYNSSLYE